jgi:diacylglycerol O-acyltransferase / wax synthase
MMNVAVCRGTRERGHIGGAPVSEIYSTGVLLPGAPVNVTVWSYVDHLGVAVLTADQTFNDVHQATDALSTAFAELRSAAGALTSSSGKNGVERRIEHAQPVVGRTG